MKFHNGRKFYVYSGWGNHTAELNILFKSLLDVFPSLISGGTSCYNPDWHTAIGGTIGTGIFLSAESVC
jgi:hypothetical protein